MSNHYNEAAQERVYEDAWELAYERGHDEHDENFYDILDSIFQELWEARGDW